MPLLYRALATLVLLQVMRLDGAHYLQCSSDFTIQAHSNWTLADVIASVDLPLQSKCCAFCKMFEACVAWTWDPVTFRCSISETNTRGKDEGDKVAGTRPSLKLLFAQPRPRSILSKPPLGFQPNILFLFPDQWRFDWDSFRRDAYGLSIPLQMPNMQKFGKLGTRFQHAYVPSPLCAPSRASLVSGREYDAAGVPDNSHDFPPNLTTFYTQLQRAGYHTMMTGKDDLTKHTQLGSLIGRYKPSGAYRMADLGVSDGIRTSGKYSAVMTYPLPHDPYGLFLTNRTVRSESGSPMSAWEAHYKCIIGARCDKNAFPDELYQDDWTASNAMELLERKPAGVPWFLQVNFPGPHPPNLVTGRMADSVANRSWPQPVDSTRRDDCINSRRPGEPQNGHKLSYCNYGAELENLDRLFGLIVDKVAALGELERTLVFVSSDHGDLTGDHQGAEKSVPWESSAAVPLLCFGGSPALGVRAGGVVDTPVATLDLAGTFVDYAGGQLAPGMTTRSLRPLLEGHQDAVVRPFVSSGLKNWRMAVQKINGTWFKFICGKGRIENSPSTVPPPRDGWTQLLYSIEFDHFDMTDLSARFPRVVEAMRPLLPASFGCGSPGDQYV